MTDEGISPQDEAEAELMNEEIVEKLKLLDYEPQFTKTKGFKPVSHTYFARKGPTPGEQSSYFVAIASWLLNLCGGKMTGDKKYDDPVTLATNLLSQMKELGMNCDIPPNKLKSGYGIPVCTVLSLLIDKALEKRNFQFKKANLEETQKSKMNDAPDIEDEAPDLINTEIDYGDNANNEEKEDDKTKQIDNEIESTNDGTNIIYSNTTTEDWQRELEKVSSKLKIDYNSLNDFSNSEWRTHVNTIKENEEKFIKEIPESRAALENLSSEIDKSLEKITKKEEIISKNHSNIISSYKEKHNASSNQVDEYNQLKETVENLAKELEETSNKIESNNEKYKKLSSKVNDVTAVSKMKQSISKLQNESLTMDMKINILNHSLLKYLHDNDNMKGSVEMVSAPINDTSLYEEVL